METVSVVIPARDSGDTIRECLKSIFRQTLKPFEIIVVASMNDSTKNSINAYIKRNFVQYIEIKSNKDFVRDAHLKRWVGAKLSKGKYIFFTDSKAILERNSLDISVKMAKKHNVHVVAGTAISWGSDSKLLISKLQDKALVKNNPSFPTEAILESANFGKTDSLPVTTALLISKKAFNSIKSDFGVDFSKVASTYDDYVTSWLLVKAGYQILLTNKVISYHKHRTNWGQYLKQISRSGQSAAIMLKYYPECPFSKRRNFQVHLFIILNILALLLVASAVLTYGFIALVLSVSIGVFISIILGTVNFLREKDIYTFVLPPISYLLIAVFSFHFLKWLYFVKKFTFERIYQYLQVH